MLPRHHGRNDPRRHRRRPRGSGVRPGQPRPSGLPGPYRFDTTRAGPRHLPLGRGPHHCMGAALMHTELRIGLTTLLTHLSAYGLRSKPAP